MQQLAHACLCGERAWRPTRFPAATHVLRTHTFRSAAHPHVDALWDKVAQQGLLQWEAVIHVNQWRPIQQGVAVMPNTHLGRR